MRVELRSSFSQGKYFPISPAGYLALVLILSKTIITSLLYVNLLWIECPPNDILNPQSLRARPYFTDVFNLHVAVLDSHVSINQGVIC